MIAFLVFGLWGSAGVHIFASPPPGFEPHSTVLSVCPESFRGGNRHFQTVRNAESHRGNAQNGVWAFPKNPMISEIGFRTDTQKQKAPPAEAEGA